MQEIVTEIIVGICFFLAAILTYRRYFRSKRKNCGQCGCSGQSSCPGCGNCTAKDKNK